MLASTEHGSLPDRPRTRTGSTISGFDPPNQDPTRRIERPDSRATPPQGPSGQPAPGTRSRSSDERSDEGYADPRDARVPDRHGVYEDEIEEAGPNRGRDLGMALLGALIGIVLTFIVIALTTGGSDAEVATGDDPRITELESELAERDQELAEAEARTDDLEALLASADADASDVDAELAAQREALDERLAALDARVEELDDRQEMHDDRQAELDDREADLDAREDALDASGDDGGDGADDANGNSGGDGPGIGEETIDEIGEAADGIVERVLHEIRNLLG